MGHLLRGYSLQREIMEGRMEGKRGRGRPTQKLLDWMMLEPWRDTVNSRKKLKTGRSGAIGRLDLLEGRELKEEEEEFISEQCTESENCTRSLPLKYW